MGNRWTHDGRRFDSRGDISSRCFMQRPKEIKDGAEQREITPREMSRLMKYYRTNHICPYCQKEVCIYTQHKHKYINAAKAGELLQYYHGPVPYPILNWLMREASYVWWTTVVFNVPKEEYKSKRFLSRCIIDMVQRHFPAEEYDYVRFIDKVAYPDDDSDSN